MVTCGQAARQCLDKWRSHPKLFSWLLLHVAELPALRGVILCRWDDEVAGAVAQFARATGTNTLLVRSDIACETGWAPRGGYVIAFEELESALRPLFKAGRVVFVLEPASPFNDLYSLSLAPVHDWDEWWIDVVGPGFDASDLKRGDVTPHEQLRVAGSDGRLVLDQQLASGASQATSREIRVRKLAAMLGCDSVDVATELDRRQETLFVENESYRPVPGPLIKEAISYSGRIRGELRRQAMGDGRVALSMSFVGSAARPVFWDVVWPERKYEIGYV